MKSLQKNVLCGILMLFSLSTFAQKNQVPVIINNCYSGYSTTLLLENQIVVESNTGLIDIAAPLFSIQINNRWGNSTPISNLSYSFKITNYNSGQAIDFENFDYLNENYVNDGNTITANSNGGYDVEVAYNSTSSTYLIDNRASGLVVAEVLDRQMQFYRGGDMIAENNTIGYTVEISNVHFKKIGGSSFETCASNFRNIILIELEDYQKTNTFSTDPLAKLNTNLTHCFPNPTKGHVYIYLKEFENNASNYSVHIYNSHGQIMINQKWNPYQAIEVSKLSEGIYNINLLNSYNEIMFTDKLVIK